MKKVIPVIIFICILVVIFYLSAQNSVKSYRYNTAILFWLKDHTSIDLYSIFRENIADIFVRKLAHFIEFSFLSLITYWVLSKLRKKCIFISTIIFCFIISVFNELLQFFIPQRTLKLLDICIDGIGIIITVGMISLIKGVKYELLNKK